MTTWRLNTSDARVVFLLEDTSGAIQKSDPTYGRADQHPAIKQSLN